MGPEDDDCRKRVAARVLQCRVAKENGVCLGRTLDRLIGMTAAVNLAYDLTAAVEFLQLS